MSDWQQVTLTPGTKLFKMHSFTCIHQGNTFAIEVDEFPDGSFTGHGEHSSDPSNVLESVSAKSLKDCLTALIKKVHAKGPRT